MSFGASSPESAHIGRRCPNGADQGGSDEQAGVAGDIVFHLPLRDGIIQPTTDE